MRGVQMKVGDVVRHKSYPDHGKGKILSFQAKMGTILVKFENLESCSYHLEWALEQEQSSSRHAGVK